MTDWQSYLNSIEREFDRWWERDALVDLARRDREAQPSQESWLNLELKVQASGRSPKARLLDLSEALRTYALDRVLLCGAPGSGKSTALVRLLLELAETARENTDSTVKIPVLVKLRLYRESVIDLLLGELARHGLSLSVEELTQQLQAGRFFLLFDDVEALPTEAAQQDLWEFLDRYHTMPTVLAMQDFPTQREFGIEKKLTVQRLRTSQASDFIEEYFPEIAAQLLPQLYGRSQEFAETPLQLQMLCVAFDRLRAVPENLGQMLRAFARYDDEQTDESEREAGNRLLKQLASQSLEGDGLTARTRVMSRQQVLIGFAECFREVGVSESQEAATSWLNRFLRHRLLREPVDGQIEFRHSLLQSYFAAEVLLERLPHLSDEVLTRDYLNFLKWTEPMVLALGLLEDEALAVRVVWLAFVQVDWMLGARLAGAVREPFQAQIVRSIAEWECSSEGSIELLKTTKSVAAVPFLQDYLNSQSLNVSGRAALALGEISSNASILALNEALTTRNWDLYAKVTEALQKIARQAGETETQTLLDILTDSTRVCKESVLEQIESNAAIPTLLDAALSAGASPTAIRVRLMALKVLEKIGSRAAVNALMQIFCIKIQEYPEQPHTYNVISSVISALGKIGSHAAVHALCEILHHEKLPRGFRDCIIQELGNTKSKSAIPMLLDLLDRNINKFYVAEALKKIGSDAAVPGIVEILHRSIFPWLDKKLTLHQAKELLFHGTSPTLTWEIVVTLGKIGNDYALPFLLRILNERNLLERLNSLDTSVSDPDSIYVKDFLQVCFSKNKLLKEVVSTLGKIGSDVAIPDLINSLDDEDAGFRKAVINALAKIGSQEAVNTLIDIYNDRSSEDRQVAIKALKEVKNEAAVNALIKVLSHKDYQACSCAAVALGEIGSDLAVEALISVLNNKESKIHRGSVISALREIGSDTAFSALLKAVDDENLQISRIAISSLRKMHLDKISTDTAIDALLQEKNPVKHEVLLQISAKMGDNRAVPALLDALDRAFKEKQYSLCQYWIEILGNIGDNRAVPFLVNFLNCDELQNIKYYPEIIKILGKIGDDRAIPSILHTLYNEEAYLDPDGEALYDLRCDVLEAAINALEKIGGDAAVEALIDLFKDEEDLSRDKGFYARDRVAEALGNVGGDAAASVLTYSLEEEDFEIFESASNALRKCAKGYHLPEINQHTDLLFSNSSLFEMLAAIQQRCGYYRHELFLEKQALLQ
ncbi:HEAT repeat domain-containing protein [Baaleninema simplex]|uniref:HEAT repeat domain-containing protein n=1 Tax=Baaleninema simplex TaxID=2862350 RepID=UPI0003487234|nr:HEAT repeat domain-containing protein [Baaleninema simplex]